jgi:hypothetical protein
MSEKYFGKNLRLCHIELSASNVKAMSLIKSSANIKNVFDFKKQVIIFKTV